MAIDFNKLDTKPRNILTDIKAEKQYKKLGRKPLPEENKRSEKVAVYLTKEQKEQIVKQAHLNFMNVSDYILQKVLNG